MATRMVVKKKSKLKTKLLESDVKETKKEEKVTKNLDLEKDSDIKTEVPTDGEVIVKKKRRNRKSNKSENIVLVVLILILIGSFCAIGLLFYKYFYAGASSNKYGDRLDGIENYPLPASLEDDIKSLYSDDTNVGKVVVHVQGKIIYIDITFSTAVKIEVAESTASKALEKIGTDNLTFYDIQYILTYSGEEENDNFPIFGAKKATSQKVVWSREK